MLALATAGLFLASTTFQGFAEDKAKTITGEGMCAKCSLKETKACQNAIKVKTGDKTVTYYLVQNDVAKAFHKNVCQSTEKVTATGTVKEVDGKQEFTATKIELVK
jgi:RecG-like helicase